MNKLTKTLNHIKKSKGKFFVAYLTGGVPDENRMIEYFKAIEKGGADIIEIGIPFSDALADGPVNQEAALGAIQNGIGTESMFSIVKQIRIFSDTPIVFLVYFNTVFKYGTEEFIKKCSEVGVDGLVIPDLPMEEREEITGYISKYGVSLIPLVAPNSGVRITEITEGMSGFTYCVSSMGVTGERNVFRDDTKNYIESVKEKSPIPVAVGFGISEKEAAAYFYDIADGIIVGSAIVRRILSGITTDELEKYIRSMTYSG